MSRFELPPDPFDWKAPFTAEYQRGNTAYVLLVAALGIAIFLVADADWNSAWALLNLAGAIAILVGATWLARKLWRSI